jgi:hypothetical protein
VSRQITKGATDQSTVIRIIDSGDGTPETGVVFNTAGIDLWYRREGATKTSITEATLSALNDAHSDGGFLHIGDGYYRLDLPDAAVATGADGVAIGGTVTGMVVIGTYHELVDAKQTGDSFARIGATGSSLTSLATQASVNTIDDFLDTEIAAILAAVDTEVAAILADTNELQTDWADGGRLDLILDARASQASVNTIDDFLDTEIAAILEDTGTTLDDFLDTEIAAILADTNELQTDWVNGGRLDLLIDAIKAKTDALTFTVANEVNANARYVAGTQLQGTGTTGDEWGPV